jgi:hypothetical protein
MASCARCSAIEPLGRLRLMDERGEQILVCTACANLERVEQK